MNSRRPSQAFTLVEMLLAVSILAVLIVVIAAMLGQVNVVWARTQAQNQQQHSGRALINFMARDIAKALMPVQTSNAGSLQFLLNPSAIGTAYSNRDNVFFQAPVATNVSSGEVAEIGYFVQWQGQTAQLCRFFVNPTDTTNYQIYNQPAAWLTTSYLGAVVPASYPSYQGLLAQNVIGLWITAYDKSGNAYHTFDSRTTLTPPDLPAFVDISILLVDPAGAARLSSSAGLPATVQALVQSVSYNSAAQCLPNLPALLKPGATCYSTRVQLINCQ